MNITPDQHLALLVADGLRFTDEITDERRRDAIDALMLIALGEATDEQVKETVKRFIGHGWWITAAFDAEFARRLRNRSGATREPPPTTQSDDALLEREDVQEGLRQAIAGETVDMPPLD